MRHLSHRICIAGRGMVKMNMPISKQQPVESGIRSTVMLDFGPEPALVPRCVPAVDSISYAKGATESNFESITRKPKHIFSVSPNLLNRAAAPAEGILVMMAIALIGENPRPRLDSRLSFFLRLLIE